MFSEKAVNVLKSNNKKIAVAESCTGGLISHTLTNTPGSSEYFLGGVIVYSNFLKTSLLNIQGEIIGKYGAVSEETVNGMCTGLKRLTNADYGVAVSGLAGPGGGTDEKPVGLVYIGVVGSGDPIVSQWHFKGNRESIKKQAVNTALISLEKLICT